MESNQITLNQLIEATQTTEETPENTALRQMVAELVRHSIKSAEVIDVIRQEVGTFSSVYDMEWSQLNPIQMWVREEAASADRAAPALRSMKAIYESLVTSEKKSGAGLSLRKGHNIVALDSEGRRWLAPRVNDSIIDDLMAAETKKEFRTILNSTGSTRHSWSIERTALIPEPDTLSERLPLPEGGSYLFIYSGDINIITKSKFKRAFAAVAEKFPVVDFLIWERSKDEPASTLWSVRGGIGHSAGVDIESWPASFVETASRMKPFLRK